MAETDSRRTRLVRLRNARFVLNGGTPGEQDALVQALARAIDREPLGPLVVAKKPGGGWLVLGLDQTSCLEVMACLEEAGIAANVLQPPD
jgi:hypothetical protein